MGRDVTVGSKLGQIVPNWTNMRLLKISFSTFWRRAPKCTETDLKKSQISPICPIAANHEIPVLEASNYKVTWYNHITYHTTQDSSKWCQCDLTSRFTTQMTKRCDMNKYHWNDGILRCSRNFIFGTNGGKHVKNLRHFKISFRTFWLIENLFKNSQIYCTFDLTYYRQKSDSYKYQQTGDCHS